MANLVIYGSRTLTPYMAIHRAIKQRLTQLPPGETLSIVSGLAQGPDDVARFCALFDFNIPCLEYEAQWDTLGKKAGYVRNVEMAEVCTEGLGFWDGQSKGTRHMVNILHQQGKPNRVDVLEPMDPSTYEEIINIPKEYLR